MKTLYFVEAFSESLYFGEGEIVSLNPEVSYELAKRTIRFLIPEDFFALDCLNSLEVNYKKVFKEWLQGFDEYLIEKFNLPKSGKVRLGRSYGYYLKLLIDPFIARICQLRAIFESEQPDRIIFVSYFQVNRPVDYQLFYKDRSIVSLLIPLFCREYGAELNNRYVNRTLRSADQKWDAFLSNLKSKLAVSLTNWRQSIHDWLTKGADSSSCLFISESWKNNLIESAERKNYRIILLKDRNGQFLKCNGNHTSVISEEEIFGCLSLFDKYSGVVFSHLLIDRIRHFTDIICPALKARIAYFENELKRLEVKFVMGSNNSRIDQFALLAAAHALDSTLAVMITHGYSIFDSEVHWSITEQPCDLYLTLNDELKNYFSTVVFPNHECSVETHASWISNYSHRSNSEKKRKRPLVLYVPTMFMGENLRLDGGAYTDTWYFKHQWQLLRYFMSETDYDFIWKSLKANGEVTDSGGYFVNDHPIQNVRFVKDRLSTYLNKVDFAIHDYPSTPFLETAQSGIPTLALYHKSLKVRDSALAFWGDITQSFSSSEEAAGKISTFLRDNPRKYMKEMPRIDTDAFEIIEEVARKKGLL